MNRIDCGERAGVWRNKSVQGGETGECGNGDKHDRHFRAACGEQYDWNQNDYADFEEHGNANGEGNERHGPGEQPHWGFAHDGVDDNVCAAGCEQDGADDGAECDQQSDAGECGAGACGEAAEGFVVWHSGADGHDKRSDHQRDEGVQLGDCNKQNDGKNAD